MYELLTHRKAFDGQSLAEIVHAVEHLRPPPPHEVRPEVPVALSEITMRAIAHDPAQRYRSARQMSQALREWIESEADLGDDASPKRGNKRRVLAATLLIGAAIGGVVGWQLMAHNDAPRPTEAVAPAPEPEPAPAPAPAPVVAKTEESPSQANAVVAAPAPPPRPKPAERPVPREPRTRTTVRDTPPKPAAAPATGVVQLAVTPWGQIEIDGKNAGVTPPLSQLTLAVGEHVITVRNEDFTPHTVTVRVSTDKAVTVRHRFGS
jgi:serine/threonine-protein kinase